MSHKPWLATYRENGIPAEINPNAYRSVVDMLDAAMKRFVDEPAFHAFGHTRSTNMEAKKFNLDNPQACVGQELGVSDWLTIDQSRIDQFAEL